MVFVFQENNQKRSGLKIRVCPKCGYAENPLWSQSRFCANIMFMRVEDFAKEYSELHSKMQKGKRLVDGNFVYYLGTKGPYVRRVEITSGSVATNYESNQGRPSGFLVKTNKWIKKMNAITSPSQRKLLET